ncbi:MAG: sulfotransferase [Phycisphaerales bacterium]|nr:sulfotransferase [Phycisphaerales bacterium]
MRLPDFLLIGAMKCGTTTLFMDLCAHPRVFMPDDKEPHNLCDDNVLTDEGRREYAALFAPARPDQKCGEASTGYTKLPTRTGVVERARKVLGPDLRLIYIVREPVARIVSHHYHLYSNGRTGKVIEDTLRKDPRLIDYTRYATQVEPWIDAYGLDAVLIVRFESFIKDRRGHAAALHRHLGIEERPEVVNEDASANRGEGKPVARGLTGFFRSPLYKKVVRGLAPAGARKWAQRTLLSKAPDRPGPPRPETVERILDELAPECERLGRIMGVSGPVWDPNEVRRRFGANDGSAGSPESPAARRGATSPASEARSAEE